MLVSPSGLRTKYAARLEFKATNNTAEYEGLILGLNKAKALGAKMLLVKTDSQIVAGQVEKEYTAREPELIKYLATVRALERRFQGFTLQYIPRAENYEAMSWRRLQQTTQQYHMALSIKFCNLWQLRSQRRPSKQS